MSELHAEIALLPRQAAPLLKVTEQTLKRWRSQGIGPKYCRFAGGRVRYRLCDIEDYLAASTVTPGSSAPQSD